MNKTPKFRTQLYMLTHFHQNYEQKGTYALLKPEQNFSNRNKTMSLRICIEIRKRILLKTKQFVLVDQRYYKYSIFVVDRYALK